MTRRHLLQGALAAAAATPANAWQTTPKQRPKTWLFWDLWRFDGLRGAELKMGKARWEPAGDYEDPLFNGHGSWPSVFRDPVSGKWRMLYSAQFQPMTLLAAESTDGIHWSPLDASAIQPPGQPKRAPNHLYSLPGGSGGSVFIDPVAGDGFRYKMYIRRHGAEAGALAAADPNHEFHEAARRGAGRLYIIDHSMLVSADGLNWKEDRSANWAQTAWHPEPPLYCYYNPALRRYFMTARPGHGERRLVLQSSADARKWSGPEPLLQPDALDPMGLQHYGMPVFAYEGQYVAFLWTFHTAAWDRPARYNHMVGLMDSQLAYSFDGLRFQRGFREPFVARNEPGQPGCGLVQPSAMVEDGDRLLIYSTAGKPMHGTSAEYRSSRQGQYHILVHTLRRDGFHYLEAQGACGGFYSKPMVWFEPDLEINASALRGRVECRITDVEWQTVPGFGFEDSVPLTDADSVRWRPAWKTRGLAELAGKPVRLELRFRSARIFAVRGTFHFLDAQDMHLLDDGQPIDTRWFDH